MKIEIAKLGEVRYRPDYSDSKARFIHKYSGIKYDYKIKTEYQELAYELDDINGDFHHSNYLQYLEIAWANHYGVVITPDIIWYTLLSELTLIVSGNSEKYARLFTKTPGEKQDIVVDAAGIVMPLDRLIGQLEPYLPIGSELFLPEFSTSTERSRKARYAAFADLVSPYYNYCMLSCGIPYVDVLGTDADWQKVYDNWVKLGELFDENKYFVRVKGILNKILKERDNSVFWLGMFRLERCGSGSQTEVFGWFTDLFYKQPEEIRYIQNYSTHIAKVCYKQLDYDKNYVMYHGLISSNLKDDCLIPDFGSVVYYKPEKPFPVCSVRKTF